MKPTLGHLQAESSQLIHDHHECHDNNKHHKKKDSSKTTSHKIYQKARQFALLIDELIANVTIKRYLTRCRIIANLPIKTHAHKQEGSLFTSMK